MRSTSPTLNAFLNTLRAQRDAPILMADCYTLTLRTGLILTFTNADVSISLNGYTYLANSILIDGLQYKCGTGLDVDQQKITISARVSDTVGGVPFLQAVRNGVLDGCQVQRERAFLTSWSAAPLGSVLLFKGRVGAVDSVGRTTAEITVNSDLVLLDMNMPRNLYSPQCVHVLYDSGCGLVKNAYGVTGTVASGSTATAIVWSGATQNFTQGTLVFSSGVNAGVSANIKAAIAGHVTLSAALPNIPSIGDSFTAYQGCAHTKTVCQTQFNNVANFRGFPFIPPPAAAY